MIVVPSEKSKVVLTMQPTSKIKLNQGEILYVTSFGTAAALRQIAYETLASFNRVGIYPN